MNAEMRVPLYEVLDVDNAEALLILTYEFQAEALARLFGASKNLPANNPLNKLRPIIIFDGLVTRENQPLQDFLSLHSISIRGGLHHAKAWCKLTKTSLELTLGSFNLTDNGIYRNREVFRKFAWSKDDESGGSVIPEFLLLMRQAVATRSELNETTDITEFLERCDSISSKWKTNKRTTKLIHNGYTDEHGLDQLQKEWESVLGKVSATELIVVSPFFDNSPDDNLLNYLKKLGLIGVSTKLTLFSALNRKGIMPMLKQYAETWQHSQQSQLYVADGKLSAENGEWSEIEKFTKETSNESIRRDQVLLRDLHAKVLILSNKSNSLVYAGSANFTQNAWTGKNKELGFCSWVETPVKAIIESLAKGLNARNPARWDAVAWAASTDELSKEEDFVEKSGYPYCLRSAILKKIDDQKIEFIFVIDEKDAVSIFDYRIFWGDAEIQVDSSSLSKALFHSQPFVLKDSLQLLLKNSLRLTPKAALELEYFFPITFDVSLTNERAQAAFTDSDDWLIKFLTNDDGISDPGPGSEFVDSENDAEDTGESERLREIHRETNRTIAMQRFMTFYLQLEINLKEQVRQFDSLLSKQPDLKEPFFKDGDPYSFANFVRLLESELSSRNSMLAETVFKLGEAKVLLAKLAGTVTNKTLREELTDLSSKITENLESFVGASPELSKLPVFTAYLSLTKQLAKGGAQ